jgi:hypothetical protein
MSGALGRVDADESIRYTFPACCASTASGAAKRLALRVRRNARRFIMGT